MRPPLLILLLTPFLFLTACSTHSDATFADDAIDLHTASPDPRWTPDEVARIVLLSMQHNDEPTPDAGIATAFRFASPANRARIGPLARFTALVKTPDYAGLLYSRSVAIAPFLRTDDTAEILVRVVTADDDECFYYMRLSRQTDDHFHNCWMTDAVLPIHSDDQDEDDDYEDDIDWLPRNPVQYALAR